MATNVFNHAPAKIFINTGSPQFGRPSMGAWVTYGIGSESQDLPGFVVLQSGPRGPRGGASALGQRLPADARYQGVPFRSGGEPILNLTSPPGVSDRPPARRRSTPSSDLNAARLADTGDPEIATRIASYEMAYRMQTSAPELIDIAGEDQKTLDMYGAEPGKRVVRQQLPAGAPAGRARRAFRAALSHRLGPSRRRRRQPDDGPRSGVHARSISRAPPWSRI